MPSNSAGGGLNGQSAIRQQADRERVNVRNGNGRVWLDKWTGEIVRLTIVAVIALGGAYWAATQTQADIVRTLVQSHTGIVNELRAQCVADEAVRDNQATVLFGLLTLTDVLTDRQKVGLEKIPPRLREQILNAFAKLPDKRTC